RPSRCTAGTRRCCTWTRTPSWCSTSSWRPPGRASAPRPSAPPACRWPAGSARRSWPSSAAPCRRAPGSEPGAASGLSLALGRRRGRRRLRGLLVVADLFLELAQALADVALVDVLRLDRRGRLGQLRRRRLVDVVPLRAAGDAQAAGAGQGREPETDHGRF